MEFKQLRAFVALADTLSFNRAAQSLFISQSALSRQIADLEKETGLQLFVRSTRKVSLTPAGEIMLAQALDILDRQTKMMVELQYSVDTEHRGGTFDIAADMRALAAPAFKKRLTDNVSTLRDVYPGIRISVQTLEYKEIMNGLREGEIDCALISERELDMPPDVNKVVLGEDEILLVFRSKNDRKDDDVRTILNERGLVLVEDDHQALYGFLNMLMDLDVKPDIRFAKTLTDVILTVSVGESSTVLPRSLLERENNDSLQALRIPSKSALMKLYFLWRKDDNNPKIMQVLNGLMDTQNKATEEIPLS